MDRAGGDIIEISSCDSGASIESEEEMDYLEKKKSFNLKEIARKLFIKRD
jgi:hypothetical protein